MKNPSPYGKRLPKSIMAGQPGWQASKPCTWKKTSQVLTVKGNIPPKSLFYKDKDLPSQ